MRTQNRANKNSRKSRSRKSKTSGRKGKLNFQLGIGYGNKSRQARAPRMSRDVMAVTAPSAVGFSLPSATFNIIGRPLATADYDTTRGIRISGSGLACFSVVNSPRDFRGLYDTRAAAPVAAQYYIPVVPGNIDPRLYQIAKTFQFYAFRTLTLVYVPNVGTTRAGNIAWGISQDSEEFLQIPAPTQQQVLEFNTAGTTPVWQTTTLEYNHPGTKTWTTNYTGTESGPVSQFYQAQIAAVCSALSTATPTVPDITGTVYVTYVIDLYEPQPVEDLLSGAASNPPTGYIGQSPEDLRMCCLEDELRALRLLCCRDSPGSPVQQQQQQQTPTLESKEDFPPLVPLVRADPTPCVSDLPGPPAALVRTASFWPSTGPPSPVDLS